MERWVRASKIDQFMETGYTFKLGYDRKKQVRGDEMSGKCQYLMEKRPAPEAKEEFEEEVVKDQ